MKILVIGATGSIGRLFVPLAIKAGHAVTAVARHPERLPPKVRTIAGDALDPIAIDGAVAGQDAVVQMIGRGGQRGATTLFSDSTRILLAAMNHHQVRRLIAVTGIGAGDSRGHGGFLYDRIIYPLFTRASYEDKNRQEALIRDSGLDWTIVRPASFTNGGRRRHLRVATDLEGITMRGVPRENVAWFLLEELTDRRYLHQTPLIGF